MKKPKLRELWHAVKVLFHKPYTSGFPAEPPVVFENFRGKPEFVPDKCIGCGACAQVCPARAIEVIDEYGPGKKPKRVLRRHYDECLYCGQCGALCTVGDGIVYTHEFDLATYAREEVVEVHTLDLVLCEVWGKPITTKEHLAWIARRLGPLAFANFTVGLSVYEELGGGSPGEPREPERFMRRSDITRQLCPDCRRAMILTEGWGDLP